MNKNASGPAIKACFFCKEGKIDRIMLENSNGPAEWEIISGSQNADLQSSVDSWMNEYCSGRQPTENLPLLLPFVSEFTSKVLSSLQKIDFGNTLSYSGLATVVGAPNACRAVGTVCGRNPFPLVIPCHRIISKSSLGGYAFGVPIKEILLKFEKKHSI